MPKLNAQGEFQVFPGVNMISMLPPEMLAPWEQVHDFLTSQVSVTKHFALLPPESYHMTLNNLYIKSNVVDPGQTDEEANAKWNNYINDNINFFTSLSHVLKAQEVTPEITICRKINTKNGLQLTLELPEDQKDKISAVNRMFNIENIAPKFFHITLAYTTNAMTATQQDNLQTLLNEKIDELFPSRTYRLLPPTLCHFQDMTAFTPWDGSHNPFEVVTNRPLIESNVSLNADSPDTRSQSPMFFATALPEQRGRKTLKPEDLKTPELSAEKKQRLISPNKNPTSSTSIEGNRLKFK